MNHDKFIVRVFAREMGIFLNMSPEIKLIAEIHLISADEILFWFTQRRTIIRNQDSVRSQASHC